MFEDAFGEKKGYRPGGSRTGRNQPAVGALQKCGYLVALAK
jgi:hypothetical protein